ncbi:tetratricopeptide repeat protein [Candidatus Riflebacteria bacterium]
MHVLGQDFDNQIEKGIKLGKEGKYRKAGNLFLKVLRKDPENVKAMMYLGICYVQAGKPDKARKVQSRILKLNSRVAARLKKLIEKGLQKKNKSSDPSKKACRAMGMVLSGTAEMFFMDYSGPAFPPEQLLSKLKKKGLLKRYSGCSKAGEHTLEADGNKADIVCSIHGRITDLPGRFKATVVASVHEANDPVPDPVRQPRPAIPRPRIRRGNTPPPPPPPIPMSLNLEYVLERPKERLAFVLVEGKKQVVGVGDTAGTRLKIEAIEPRRITVSSLRNPARKKDFELRENLYRKSISNLDPATSRAMERWHETLRKEKSATKLNVQEIYKRKGEFFASLAFHFRHLVVSAGETVDETIRILEISAETMKIENLLSGKTEIYRIRDTNPR